MPGWETARRGELAASAWRVWENGVLAGNCTSSVGYTGYYSDSESGLNYAHQRYQLPGIGRFLSADPGPIIFDRPITINRYLYANGNPVIYIDPDGRIALLANGADQLENFRGWLADRTKTYDQGVLGQVGAISGGVARGFVAATEGALRGVNYVANVGSVALAEYGLNNEEWAAEHFRETQGTHAAAVGAYNYVVHQGGANELYERGKDVLRRADAGEVQALGEVTEFATGFVSASGAAKNTVQQTASAALRSAQELETLALAAAQRAKNAVDGAKRVFEGPDGTPAVTLEKRHEMLAENDFVGDSIPHPVAETTSAPVAYGTPFKQLSRKSRAKLLEKVEARTITREEWNRLQWNDRLTERRQAGIDAFWAQERQHLTQGLPGSRDWSPDALQAIQAGGTPRGIYGHHRYSVSLYPQLANDAANIAPTTFFEHFYKWHGGNWRNPTSGVPLRPDLPDQF